MKTVKFKTSINCGHCLKTVSPSLDGNVKIEKWAVDLNNPDKILNVVAIDDIIPENIINDLGKLGFSAVEFE